MTLIDARRNQPDIRWFDNSFGSAQGAPIAVFDFDGVICSPVEDWVYKLKEIPNEKTRLIPIAKRFGIDFDLYDVPYLRHLVFQELLAEKRCLPESGPLLELAKNLSRNSRPFFILTARSGRAAISRALSYINRNQLAPQEIFFVGRVPKGRQLRLIRDMVVSKRQVVFFEDNKRHARNSRYQDFVDFETVYVQWGDPDWATAEEFYQEVVRGDSACANVKGAA